MTTNLHIPTPSELLMKQFDSDNISIITRLDLIGLAGCPAQFNDVLEAAYMTERIVVQKRLDAILRKMGTMPKVG